jgi:hypothetical protein
MQADEIRPGATAEIGPDELAAQEALELPDRQALSLIDPSRLSGGLVSTGQTTPDPAQLTGQQTANPAQASQPAVDASHFGSQTTSGALGSATASPQPYQPSTTSTAQS